MHGRRELAQNIATAHFIGARLRPAFEMTGIECASCMLKVRR